MGALAPSERLRMVVLQGGRVIGTAVSTGRPTVVDGARHLPLGQSMIEGSATFTLTREEAAPLLRAIREALGPRPKRRRLSKAAKSEARDRRMRSSMAGVKRRRGVHFEHGRQLSRKSRADRLARARYDRDRDRHDVWDLIALGMEPLFDDDGGDMDPRWDVYERGIFEHVGRGRRGDRRARYLAQVGEFDDALPF